MMAQPFPAHAGIAPGHPGMQHAHPMAGMQHPSAGHMGGQPQPGMMQSMHPGVSGPQVTQGPMVTGMPPGAGTPAPGPLHSGNMAMAHLGPQQAMFQQHNPQMNFGQMQMTPQQQQLMARQRMIQMQAQQQQQQHQAQGMQMMPNGQGGFSQAQMAQMKMGMMPPQMQMQMQANHPQMQNFQQQQQQQRFLQAQQQAQAAQMAAASQRAVAQQMQMSRSQEQTTQAPPPQPTPAPQPVPQPAQQPPPTPQAQAQPAQPKPQPQPVPTANNPQQQQQAQSAQHQQQAQNQQQQQAQQQQQPQHPNQHQNQPAKTAEGDDEPQIKQQPDMSNNMMIPDLSKTDLLGGQCILQLILWQDILANPERPNDLDYWEDTMRKYFSPFASIRQQLCSNKNDTDKSFQLPFPCLARYYHSHFASGVKQIFLQSYDHNQNKLSNGGVHIWSSHASLTYVFTNDIRVSTTGQLRVTFDEMQKIDHLNISTTGWQEYIPRSALITVPSPEVKQSPKITNKNLKRTQGKGSGPSSSPVIPSSGVGEFGVPNHIFQFLEVAEVMTAMGPIMDYYNSHPGVEPKDALYKVTLENTQSMTNANNARLQNQMARAANGHVPVGMFPNQMNPAGMNVPNQFNSPAMGHLGVPQGQGSPMLGGPNHTPSPAQNPAAGGVAMIHQMSAQGSNLSGSQGPSTNTSPNVSNKRRRASQVKEENDGESITTNKVKPSPKISGKRQKGS
ncbi:hypothetical protein PV10_01820 [Exophiala mesophila]|uniref:LIM-domain binding protein-domain-containing protein n=1 Tax=Exophiala mesophila TaxID=212818 RepID=A0A0D1X853_EXOME|nr:uncharacterized protein PV10_01820 [Exophiala mesophila]KIV98140.1 hypothetical protein PV10_01820 [Exophiala mesophila]